MVYVYCGTSASYPGWEQYWVFLMSGLAQRPMTLLVVPVPWALQKGWIKSVFRNFQLTRAAMSLFGGGQPNRHGCALPWILHPACLSHRQRLGKFNPSTKRSRLMGRESYFESCICSERVITCSTNSSPVFFLSRCSLGHLCTKAQIQAHWTRTPFLSGWMSWVLRNALFLLLIKGTLYLSR